MKKLFTLALALIGLAGVANAATEDDLEPLKHSYVLVCDQLGERPGKGALFGANHFLDLKGGSVATNKGQVDLSVLDPAEDADGNPLPQYVTQDIVDKYGAIYGGPHYNWLRLKNQQDMLALKLTAKSKIIIFLQGNNKVGKEARIPRISTDVEQKNSLNEAPGEDYPKTVSGFKWEFTVDDDGLYYLGSYNGDMFVSFIIIEANEAPGTPMVVVGDQTYEDGLWFREVTCTPVSAQPEGADFSIPTIVTYTTDGSTPTADSDVYTGPIKCYKEQVLKFQAYYDMMGGSADESMICPGADNEAAVSFQFEAPSISADGANVTITTPYDGAKNFYSLNGGDAVEGSSFTLEESATVSAYTEIANGSYTTFTTNKTTQDVYVLNPIKTKKTIQVIAGDVVVDEEASAQSTTGLVYTIENGAISADKADFFVKNLTFKAVMDEQYQAPEGNERYIQMSNTNITFQVEDGDEVNVKVLCSKNSCKNIEAEDNEDGSLVNDRKCIVNVSGTNYYHLDAEGNEASDVVLCEDANIIEFSLTGGTYTFQKYSGTGNIMIASIEIAPANANAIKGDVNGDGTVDVADISAILNHMAGTTLSDAADVNGDGTVDVADISSVLNIMAGTSE